MLAAAVRRSRRWTGPKLRSALQHTRGFHGVTGETTVLPASGNRADPPVVILDVNPAGRYVVNRAWANFAGYF
jgi:ABC-type branched-subunit amino acid transport system substrate-binding protein